MEVSELPVGPEWTFETKWDGYRGQLQKVGTESRLMSRKNKELTKDFPTILLAARSLPVDCCLLDGEIVALDEHGRPSFAALQRKRGTIIYVAYDLLFSDGKDWRDRPLHERRRELRRLTRGSAIQFSDELGTRKSAIRFVRGLDLEGILAKDKNSSYVGGETDRWRKLKFYKQQDFVVGGYRPNGPSVDALLVGYFEGTRLRFASKVRARLTAHEKREWFKRLGTSEHTDCPFVDLALRKSSPRSENEIAENELRQLKWVVPRWVIAVRFLSWTEEGLLREAAYAGLRHDTKPLNVRRL